MILDEQTFIQQAVTCSRLASENYTFRDLVVQLQARIKELEEAATTEED